MFSLGCVQSMRCHTDTCPTGVATQSKARQRGLVVAEKAQRVANFHRGTLKALHEMVVAAGLDSPDDFRPWHLRQRINVAEMKQMDEIYPVRRGGRIARRRIDPKSALGRWWRDADPDSFAARGLTNVLFLFLRCRRAIALSEPAKH